MPRWLLLVFLAGTAAFGAGPDSMRVAVRYKQILAAEPVEGMALDRLWKIAQEGSATGALIDEYKARTDTFSGAMIYGHLLRKAGRVEEAGAAYKSAAKLDVKSPLPHLALAQNFLDRGTPAEAAGEFEQGVALLSKNDPKLPDALAQLATAWLAANESAKASNALERICAANPGDLAMRQRLAEIYEKSGLASEAATHWDYIAAHGAPAERAQAFQNVARIRRGNGDVDGAIAALEQALVLTGAGNWLRPELETQIIKIHERYQRMAELEARWQKQASENPRDVAAASQLVHFYERAGDLEKERGWLETLCALAPKNVEHTAKLARVCVQTGNFDRAAALLDEALAAQPANADYVFARADVDVCRNATGTARERIEKLLDRQPGDDALTARALEWFQKNRAFEAAEAHLKRVAHDENSILELASFYFSQNKHDEAKRALQKLVHDGQSSGEQAAACGKIAEILREQSDLPAALEAIRRAVDLQPQAFQWRLTHADLLLSAQRFEDAQNEAQRGFALAGSEAEREKADQKLFQIFQSRNAEPAADRASFVRVTKRGDPLASQTRAAGSALEIFVRGLLDDANAHATAAKFLRVARWQVRMRKNREALDAARRAIALDARMPAARELAVTAARAIGQRDAAVGELRDLMELEPARKNFFLRQIGELEMELRHTGAATQIFEELAAANPGSVDALSDLALTLQQAERWPDVLATWQRALAASAPPKKKQILQPLLQVMDRLKMRREAAKLVLDLIDAQHDDNERFALLPELIVQCQGFELQKWLIEQLARRHQAHPDDYFIAAASAKVLKENGRGGEALAVLADVAWSSHDEIAPLRELVAEAEELGETAAACDLQKRLVALSPGAESHARAKLADLQEAALDIAAATTEWNRLAKLFPRDGSLLLRAADFSLRWAAPDRAREILRSVCTLDPGNAEAALKLAAIADDAEAVGCYEQILAHSAPDKDGVLSLIVTALHLRESKAIEPNARFVAIRGLGQSLAARGDSAAMRAWLERWDRQTAPAESFLEQYFAGAHARALSQLRNLSTADAADPALRSAWMLLAFQIGDAAMLRSILDDGDATAREELMRVLGEFANSEIAPARLRVVDEVFNEKTSRDIVWQAAVQLASHNRFREAARLGQRVFDGATTLRAPCGLELADWYLRCGGKDKAMETLRAISAEAGDSLQQPVYAALRELFLLLPPPERAQWVERVAQNLDREKLPIHACLAMILLHGLQGDERAAEAEIARLIELRATTIREAEVIGDSGERYWSFVLTTGLQLRLWNLDREAAFLWERALADPASIRLQRGSARVAAREIATRLSALKMESAPGEDAESLARDYLQTTTPEVVQALVSQLESDGALLLASRLARAAWEREPDNVQLLHSFVTTAVSAGDREGMHAATSEKFKTGAGTPARRELTLQGAGFLERTGEADEARKLLEAEITLHPQDIELLEKAAGVDERRGHFEDAETLHRYLLSVDPAHPARKAALANVLAAEKKFSEAIGLLEQIPENGATDQLLAPLYLKSGRLDRVRALGAKFLRAGNSDAVDRSVSALAEAGQVKEALQLLFAASIKTKDSRALFSLEAKFVELAAPEFPSLAKSGLSRLERIARNSPEFIEPLLETESRVGAKLGINLEERFAAEWREGKGAAVAGVKMIELYARTGPEHKLEAVFAQCLAREEIEQVVSQKLASALQAERRLGLRERWLAAIRDRWPENEQFALDHVETLHALGRDEEALAELRIFAGRALVESDDTAKAAPLLAELGDREKACEMFALAIHADPLTRNGALRTEYARQLRAAGKPKEAMELLERANDRAPANFEIAEGLSSFQLEKNQRVPAAKVWKHLARASAEPAQRAKALEQLALVEADHH